MFRPPFCPHETCSSHTQPDRPDFVRWGFYRPKCRSHAVPRFRCPACGRTFSRQTFRMDWRHKKPYLNARLLTYLNSGVGLRQCARILPLSRRCTELKARCLGRHLRRINVRLPGQFGPDAAFQLDELETYETRRRERPVTFSVLIESTIRFHVWGESATLSPRGKFNERRRRAIEREIERFGPRRDNSRVAVRRTLERLKPLVEGLSRIAFHTDEKSTYPGLLAEVLGKERVVHTTTSSRAVRNVANPLFPINQTEAIARDLMGRLRRQSWLVSKKRRYLGLAFHAYIAWKNYVRPRFNRDKQTPAQLAGFLSRPLRMSELLGWRQDWTVRSMNVTSRYA